MLTIFNENIFAIIIAGIINGSFVIPTRYIKNYSSEKIWLYHSIIGLAIIPWLMLLFFTTFSSTLIHHYLTLPFNILIKIILGGFIFGLGQICFFYALKNIGIALSFAINLSISVMLGTLFFTQQPFPVLLAVGLIVCSLIFYYFSTISTKQNNLTPISSHYYKGWMFACLAGIASGIQNITFVWVSFHTKTAFQMAHSFWIWPPFLLAAAIPMSFGFLYQIKEKEPIYFPRFTIPFENIKNILLIILMGLCFTGSLVLYSYGMDHLSAYKKILGWPIFMILIILTSQAWGGIYSEFKTNLLKNKIYKAISISLLIISILLLSH